MSDHIEQLRAEVENCRESSRTAANTKCGDESLCRCISLEGRASRGNGGLRIGSVFSGIGGLELGLERSGLGHVVWQIEIEPFCRAVLEKHWPEVARYEDVKTVTALPRIDVLCGGFPCQDISVAGKAAGIAGARSSLWFEMLRLVRELRPQWVLIENVPALRTRGADTVLEGLESEGYACWPLVVGAEDVGAPHRRRRVWIVAHAHGSGLRDEQQRMPWGREADVRDQGATEPGRDGTPVAYRESRRLGECRGAQNSWKRRDADSCSQALADGDSRRCERERQPQLGRFECSSGDQPDGRGPAGSLEYGPIARLEGQRDVLHGRTGGLDNADLPRPRITCQADSGGGLDGCGESPGDAAWPSGPEERQHCWEPPRCVTRVESGLGDVPDGLPWRLAPWTRRQALRALGNAAVPQVAEVIGRAIVAVLREAEEVER